METKNTFSLTDAEIGTLNGLSTQGYTQTEAEARIQGTFAQQAQDEALRRMEERDAELQEAYEYSPTQSLRKELDRSRLEATARLYLEKPEDHSEEEFGALFTTLHNDHFQAQNTPELNAQAMTAFDRPNDEHKNQGRLRDYLAFSDGLKKIAARRAALEQSILAEEDETKRGDLMNQRDAAVKEYSDALYNKYLPAFPKLKEVKEHLNDPDGGAAWYRSKVETGEWERDFGDQARSVLNVANVNQWLDYASNSKYAKPEWMTDEQAIKEMKAKVANEEMVLKAMSLMPLLSEKQKDFVKLGVNGADISVLEGLMKGMTPNDRDLMRSLVQALRPEYDGFFEFANRFASSVSSAGRSFGRLLEGGKVMLPNAANRLLRKAYGVDTEELAYPDTLEEEKVRAGMLEDIKNYEALTQTKFNDPEGFFHKAWDGWWDSFGLQGSVLAAYGARHLAARVALSGHPVLGGALMLGSLAAQGYCFVAMTGEHFDNLIKHDMPFEQAVPFAIIGGALDTAIENMNIEAWFGKGFSAAQLRQIGFRPLGRAVLRWDLPAIRSALALDAHQWARVTVSELCEEMAQAMDKEGILGLAQGRSIFDAYLSEDATQAALDAFVDALPTCSAFGLTAAANVSGSNKKAAAYQYAQSLDHVARQIALREGVDELSADVIREKKTQARNKADEVARATAGMTPAERAAWLAAQEGMSDAERAFYAEHCAYLETVSSLDGEEYAAAVLSGSIDEALFAKEGWKFEHDKKTGAITGITDARGKHYAIKTENRAASLDDLSDKDLVSFIKEYNELAGQMTAAGKKGWKAFAEVAGKGDLETWDEKEKARLAEVIGKELLGSHNDATGLITLYLANAGEHTLTHELQHAFLLGLKKTLGGEKDKAIRGLNMMFGSGFDEGVAMTAEGAAKAAAKVDRKLIAASGGDKVNWKGIVHNIGQVLLKGLTFGKHQATWDNVFTKASEGLLGVTPTAYFKEIIGEAMALDREEHDLKTSYEKKIQEVKDKYRAKREEVEKAEEATPGEEAGDEAHTPEATKSARQVEIEEEIASIMEELSSGKPLTRSKKKRQQKKARDQRLDRLAELEHELEEERAKAHGEETGEMEHVDLDAEEKAEIDRLNAAYEEDLKRLHEDAEAGTFGEAKTHFSIGALSDGRRFVDVDNVPAEIANEKDLNKKRSLVRKLIQQRWGNQVIDEDGVRAFVNGGTAKEYTSPAKRLATEPFSDKLEAASELDKIVATSTNPRRVPDGKDGHKHKGVKEWEHRDTILKVGDRFYSSKVNIAILEKVNAKGENQRLLHDITEMKDVTDEVRRLMRDASAISSTVSTSMTTGHIIPYFGVGSQGGTTRFSIAKDVAARREYDAVVAAYTNADGTKKPTWMKAPNGKKTKLTERQWVQVRTRAFKAWFGDWEGKAIAQAILRDEDLVSTSDMLTLPVEEQRKKANELYAKIKAEGNVETNDGRSVKFTRTGLRKVRSHSADPHTLALLPILRDVIHTAHYIGDDMPNEEKKASGRDKDVKAYHYYAKRVNLGDGSMIARIVIREEVNGDQFYDEDATSLEYVKGIYGQEPRIPITGNDHKSPFTTHSIAYFFAKIKGENCSKVVDENGEPLQVYHSTLARDEKEIWNGGEYQGTIRKPFTIFKRSIDGYRNNGNYFTSDSDNAGGYGDYKYTTFLNLQNPLVIDCKGMDFAHISFNGERKSTDEWSDWAEKNGYDGVIFRNVKDGMDLSYYEHPIDEYVAFRSNQIKSATDNVGSFSARENDIRYSLSGIGKLDDAESVKRFKAYIEKLPAAVMPKRLASGTPQAALEWFEKNMVGRTFQFYIPKYGYREFTATPGHIGKLVCEGGKRADGTKIVKGRIAKANGDAAKGLEMVRRGEVSAAEVEGWSNIRAKSLPLVPEVLTDFDAALHEKDARGNDIVIFLKKFTNKDGRSNTVVMKLVNDTLIGPLSAHVRDMTDAWLKNKDLLLTSEGEVYDRSTNNSASRKPFAGDNAEGNSPENADIIPQNGVESQGGISRFSISSPIERRKDLVALHNVSKESIKDILALGGFAMPSIAIVKDSHGHRGYGDVTVLFGRETIDPKKRKENKIYSHDAWTPTFPEVSLKIDMDKVRATNMRLAEMVPEDVRKIFNWHEWDYARFEDDGISRAFSLLKGGNDAAVAYGGDEIVKAAYLISKGEKVEVVDNNSYKTEEALRARVDINDPAYKAWVNEQYGDVVLARGIRNETDWYTPDGTRRRKWDELYDPVTLDAAVEMMKAQQVEQGEGGIFGRDLFGAAAKKYSSIPEVVRNEDKLKQVSREEMKALKERIADAFRGAKEEFIRTKTSGHSDSDFASSLIDDEAEEIIFDAWNNSRQKFAAFKKGLNTQGYSADEELAKELYDILQEASEIDTTYFEAKPQRAVRVDEAKAWIVPDTIDAADKAALEARGQEVHTYKEKDEADRLRVVNEVADKHRTRFSIGEPRGVQKQAGVNYPDAADEIAAVEQDVRFSIGSKKAAEYRAIIAKKRPDLDAAEIDATMGEIAKFETPKAQKAALNWYIRGRLRLPEDAPKVTQALEYAENAKADPMQFAGPVELMEALHDFKPKAKMIDPDTVPYLSDKRDMGHGVTTYLVDESRESQQAMREVINTHWGEDANPWCLLCGDGYGNLEKEAWNFWNRYNALPKRVAFKNGKLLAFMATEGMEAWWDHRDYCYNNIPYGNMKVPNDPFGRWGDYELIDGEIIHNGTYRKGQQGQNGYRKWLDSKNNCLLLEACDDSIIREWDATTGDLAFYTDKKRNMKFGAAKSPRAKHARIYCVQYLETKNGNNEFVLINYDSKGKEESTVAHCYNPEFKKREKTILATLRAWKAEAERILAEEEANNPNYKANGERHSIGTLSDGRRFVDVDNVPAEIANEKNFNKKKKLVAKLIRERWAGKIIDEDGVRAFVNGETAHEYVNPAKRPTPQVFRDKLDAASELDKIIATSTNPRHIPDGQSGHKHEGVKEWEHRDALLKIGDRFYAGKVNIEILEKTNANGEYRRLLHDITEMKDVTDEVRRLKVASNISDNAHIIPYSTAENQGESLPHMDYHREDEWRDEADEATRHALARGPHSAKDGLTAYIASQILAGKNVTTETVDTDAKNLGMRNVNAADLLVDATNLANKNREKARAKVAAADPSLMDDLKDDAMRMRVNQDLDNALTQGAAINDPFIGKKYAEAAARHAKRSLDQAKGFTAKQLMAECPIDPVAALFAVAASGGESGAADVEGVATEGGGVGVLDWFIACA